jgi:hypothetical protein
MPFNLKTKTESYIPSACILTIRMLPVRAYCREVVTRNPAPLKKMITLRIVFLLKLQQYLSPRSRLACNWQ